MIIIDTIISAKNLVSRTTIETRLSEIDPYGIVNNSEYYNYFEIARLDLLALSNVSTGDFIKKTHLVFYKCKFISPLSYQNSIIVTSKFKNIDYGKRTFEIEQSINITLINKLIAKSTSIFEVVDAIEVTV